INHFPDSSAYFADGIEQQVEFRADGKEQNIARLFELYPSKRRDRTMSLIKPANSSHRIKKESQIFAPACQAVTCIAFTAPSRGQRRSATWFAPARFYHERAAWRAVLFHSRSDPDR